MIQSIIGRAGITQNVAYTGTAGTITNPIGSQTYKVRVVTTSAAFVKIDNNPTATNADFYLPANTQEYFITTPGESVSALQVSAGGTLYVTELI